MTKTTTVIKEKNRDMKDKITLQVGIPLAALRLALTAKSNNKTKEVFKPTLREKLAAKRAGNAGYVKVPVEEMDMMISTLLRYKAQVDRAMDHKYGKEEV